MMSFHSHPTEASPPSTNRLLILAPVFIAVLVFMLGCQSASETKPENEPKTDEAAKRAKVEGVGLDEAAYDYFSYHGEYAPDFFKGMDEVSWPPIEQRKPDPLLDTLKLDNGQLREPSKVVDVELKGKDSLSGTTNEVIGRNTWMIWCGGNERFWDYLANDSLGFVDFVKLLDTRTRNQRFRESGLINEPQMAQSGETRTLEYGLWLDQPEKKWVREWREAYLKTTFAEMAAGTHKSQIGLRKRDENGQNNGELLSTLNDPPASGYLYPSQYLSEEKQNEIYAAALAGKYEGKSADSYEGEGEDESEDKDEEYETKKHLNQYDQEIPPPDWYGLSSGVIGLRLFPNPYFDKEAQEKWDPERYYNDKDYHADPNLVRPFRVGMSCAFCHTSFHPLRPPRDENNPEWKNLSGNIGAQYLSMRATVGNLLKPESFVYHLLESQPRGTIDTSLVASDNVNNPNTMNAVFGLPQRAIVSLHNPKEKLDAASAMLPSLWDKDNKDETKLDPIPDYWKHVASHLGVESQVERSNKNPRHVPRILLDGSDSIGTFGALARVYLNIGTYSEQWNEIHDVVVGFEEQRPFKLGDCDTNSVYWNATKRRVSGLRDYFLRVTPPMPLLATEGGEQRLRKIKTDDLVKKAKLEKRDYADLYAKERALHVDIGQLAHGRRVFAENCIVCHSSIQPESSIDNLFSADQPDVTAAEAAAIEKQALKSKYAELIERRKQYRAIDDRTKEYWEHDPGRWMDDDRYQEWALDVVEKPEFWRQNYLSTDYRIPINVVGTNSARAMATNGMTGHMWEEFASADYRQLPSPGEIEFFNPYKGENGELDTYSPRHKTPKGAPEGGGGPGYYRVPSLISVWATAPLLHNNSLGLFNNDPSVDGRLEAFDDAIRKMLWPEKRLESSSYNGATAERLKRDRGLIWRTPQETYLTIDAKKVPNIVGMRFLRDLGKLDRLKWVKRINPIWLPSFVLFAGALLMLLVSNSKKRRLTGYALLAFAAALAVASWLAHVYPQLSIVDAVRSIYPVGLSLGAVLFVAAVLILPITSSPKWTRYIAYAFTVLALLLGGLTFFFAGKLGELRIGPIPAGTPVNLLANFNSEADRRTQVRTINTVLSGLAEIKNPTLTEEDTAKVMKQKIAPALMEVNKCPDFVMDKGHYFPWFDEMTDDDKNALIELLKTL